MKSIYKIFKIISAGCVLLPGISCKKFVQIEPAPNLIETEAVFSSDQTAVTSVLGLYVQMRNQNLSIMNGGPSVFAGLSADEIYNTASNATADPFFKNALLANNSTINSNFWGSAYRSIYQVNAIIEGLEKSNSLTDSLKRQLLGEMKFARAFYYHFLVNLFGDVPLVTTTNYQLNSTISRNGSGQVIQQMIADLQEAQQLLKTYYPSTNRARPNKWTATALLARVYLYQKDWVNAEAEATMIINSGQYGLNANLNNVFIINNNEIIWQLARDGSNTAEGATFIPASATTRPTYAITTYLLNSFEPGDQRKTNWLKSNVVSGQTYYYPFKYKVRTATPVSEYEVVFRLAEFYLIRAEAKARQNNVTGAKDDLNIIRSRAGLPNSPAATQTEILSAIEQERRVELFTEWGHRWLDLKRNNLAEIVLGPIKAPNWQSTDVLYPIPQVELDRNPFLVQNPGY
jgi:hypothetical protein